MSVSVVLLPLEEATVESSSTSPVRTNDIMVG
jgi:hypothetical protein